MLHRRKRLAKPVWCYWERYQASVLKQTTNWWKKGLSCHAFHDSQNTLVLLKNKSGKGKKSTSGWQNVQTVTNVENDCIVNEGALTVPFNMNKAVAQKFYYCLDALCITNWPLWTNVPSLLELTFDSNITDDSKKEIFSLLNI